MLILQSSMHHRKVTLLGAVCSPVKPHHEGHMSPEGPHPGPWQAGAHQPVNALNPAAAALADVDGEPLPVAQGVVHVGARQRICKGDGPV